MNFLTEKIQKYHKKKLNDAIQELQFHLKKENQLEAERKKTNDESKRVNIEEQIDKENEIIDIWRKNIEKVNEQLKKLQR